MHVRNFKRFKMPIISLLLGLSLTACGFHLKKTAELPAGFKQVSLQGIGIERNFGRVLKDAFTDARSDLQANGSQPTKLTISNLEEKRRVAAYNFDRTVRQYLLYMKFDYTLEANGKKLGTFPVNIDAILNYDSDFVLGEQEEQRLIRHDLRKDAARLIYRNPACGRPRWRS